MKSEIRSGESIAELALAGALVWETLRRFAYNIIIGITPSTFAFKP